ncbi:MAG: hypothetical protein QXP34_03185 [Candidatus Aenigmatarchaeota archaeon]
MVYLLKKVLIKDNDEIDYDTSNYLTNKLKNKKLTLGDLLNLIFDFIRNEITINTYYNIKFNLHDIKLKIYENNIFIDVYNDTLIDEVWVIYLIYDYKIVSLFIFLNKI